MDVDSQDESQNRSFDRRQRFERDLETVLTDKVLDLKKTFSKNKWENLKKKQSENQSPSLERRDIETQPCGLYNSGNFCYVNSFLQTWYNDLVFRQCIYDWHSDSNFKRPESAKMDIQEVMNSLQRLFLTMQITPYEHTDASELINLLKLKNDQQDVQEFSILFFDAISRHLESHPNGEHMRQKILNRVVGKTKKTIECTCGKKKVTEEEFRSILLHINNGANSLSALFQNHMETKEVMGDYLCDECGTRGNTTIVTEYAHLPEVLVVQLNRYQYDQVSNRNRKVTTAIQYPRQLREVVIRPTADPNSIYDLGAVMIHEGLNVSCGHYYDIIKDSKTGNWFAFNDKEVTQAKKPGVASEKQKIGRASPDMKGCYVLIYRKIETPIINAENGEDVSVPIAPELRMPPAEIVDDIQRKLNESFQDKTIGENLSYKVWNNCLTERHQTLEHFWSLLEVENVRSIIDHPNNVVFLPTELFKDIQEKEFKAVNTLKDMDDLSKDKNKNTADDDEPKYMNEALAVVGGHDEALETDEEYMQRLMEATQMIREEKQAALVASAARIRAESRNGVPDEDMLKLLYVREPLSDIEMPLCQHEKLLLETLKKGQIKAVNKATAVQLLRNYGMGVRLKRFATDEKSNGAMKEENLYMTGLKTGADLCEECVDLMRREKNFNQELEACVKIVNEIKKRSSAKGKKGYEYPPSDAYWVSYVQINRYKGLATDEMKYRKSLGMQKPSSLVFSTKFDGFNESLRSFSRLNKNADRFKSDEFPPEKRRRLNSNDKQSSSSQKEGVDVVEVGEKSESTDEKSELNGEATENEEKLVANGTSTHSANSEAESNSEKSNGLKEVYFNSDLICCHGKLDNKPKRIWIHKHEWEQLVVENFQKYREFPVTTAECAECSDAFNIWETQRIDCCMKLQQINQAVGQIIKRVEKRATNFEAWDYCTHMICPKFVHKYRYALKQGNKTPVMPTICQSCLLCSKHNLPFQPFTGGVKDSDRLRQYDEACSEISQTQTLAEFGVNLGGPFYDPVVSGPLPLTADEWKSILTEFRIACGDEFDSPAEVLIQNGNYESFCDECNVKFNDSLLCRQCNYPDGADIFIKLNEDEGENARNCKAAPTTRRAALKNLIKCKMASTNTVGELKVELYRRIRQSPKDQLLYLGSRLLEDNMTLGEAHVVANNSESPLTLITQTHTEISDEPRVIEKGFCDTALAT